jgi:hypothetical protein
MSWSEFMASNHWLKSVLTGSKKVASRRKVRALLDRAARATIDSLEGRRMLSSAPVANPGGPYVVDEGKGIVIDAGLSTDDGTIAAYGWDLNYKPSKGFRRNVTGQAFTYQAGDSGAPRTIALRVVDNEGNATIQTTTIAIDDVSPSVKLVGESAASEGATYSLAWSSSDPGNDIIKGYSISWGDGTTTTHGATDVSTTHVYAQNDNYTINFTTIDADGAHITKKSVEVSNVAPTGDVVGTIDSPLAEGATVRFAVNVADAGVADTHTFNWRVEKDGNPWALPEGLDRTSATFDFTPTDQGSYIVGCAIADADGGQFIANSSTLTVINADPTATVSGGADASEGDMQTLQVSATDAGVQDTLQYAWTVTKDGAAYALPEGVATDADTLVFAPDDDGVYVASVTVTDGDGGTVSSSSNTFTVANVAPTATLTAPTTDLIEGNSLSFSVLAADAGLADRLTYAWSVEKNGTPFDVTTPTSAETFAFAPDDEGSYVVRVVITDDDGASITQTNAPIIVANAAPIATISDALAGAIEGDTISFASTHTDGGVNDSIAYLWTVTKDGAAYTLAPGTIDDTEAFDLVTTDNGDYVVTLSVTDGTSSSTTTRAFSVLNSAPIGMIAGEPLEPVDEGATINLAVTVADAGLLDTFTYEWRVELDGTPVVLPDGYDFTHDTFSYVTADNGNFVIGCVVSDNAGGQHIASSGTIAVENVAPTGTISGTPVSNVDEGATQSFIANPTDAGVADTFGYEWTVSKDGVPVVLPGDVTTTEQAFAFAPADNGDYVVSVVITDDNAGRVTVSSATFTVNNVAPTAVVVGPTAGDEGTPLSFTSAQIDAGADDTHSYAWSVTKDGAPYGLPQDVVTNAWGFVFTPNNDGAYVASVVVSDDDGGSVTATGATTNVANAAPEVTFVGQPSDPVAENSAVTIGTSVTDPGVNDTKAYAWSVTRNGVAYDLAGVIADAAELTFTPSDNGAYVLTVTVTDGDGGSKTVSQSLDVVNVDPVASVTTQPADQLAQGSNATYAVEATDQSPIDVLGYAWQVTRGGLPYALPSDVVTRDSTFTFVPTLNGTYVVTVSVTDNDGGATGVSSNLNVTNVAPTIHSVAEVNGAGGTIAKQTTLSYAADVTDPGSEDLAYSWVAHRGADVFATGNGATFDFVPTLGGDYYVQLTVSDGIQADSVSSSHLTVANDAPVASIADFTATPIEGNPLTFVGSATDVDGDPLTYAWTISRDGVDLTGTGESFGFTPTDDGEYAATVVVSDGIATTKVTKTFVVENYVPTGSLGFPMFAGVNGWDAQFNVEDVSRYINDAVTVDWNWGDGQTNFGQALSTTPTHRWAEAGSYEVTATFNDDDGGSSSVSRTFVVNDYGMQPDPMGDGVALVVNGTSADDAITFEKTKTGKIRAVRNGVSLGQTFSPTRVIVDAGDGANSIVANPNVAVPVLFLGGSGKDTLTGGAANDVLIGKAGDDEVTGGKGRDFLIGGDDSDTLSGLADEDILVGGNHASSDNFAELGAIMGEWGDTSRNFVQRSTRLRNGAEGLAALFAIGTVIGDSRSDQITAGTDAADWIYKDTFANGDAIADETPIDRVDVIAA